MNNFTFCNPTKIVFGKGSVGRLRNNIPGGSKVLLTYGGGSVQRNGIYDQVMAQLEGISVVPFGGIEANPDCSTVDRAIEVARQEGCNVVLAVGGGSVIDASKVIAMGVKAPMSSWEMVKNGYRGETLPLGVVLTVPATGSEMNAGAVLSNRALEEKFAITCHHPLFSILDPTYTYTLSSHQVACGVADVLMHILEQYLTTTGQSGVMDRMAEGVLLNLLDIAPSLMKGNTDYDVACEYMLSATLGLNYMLSMGVEQDWLTHYIGHELTALTGTTHGASLMLVLPAVMEEFRQEKGEKIVQLGRRVFGLTGLSEEATIGATIQAVEDFIHSLGLAASMKEGGISETVAEEVATRFEHRGGALGERGLGTPERIRNVIRRSMR
ncbi:iron-containing alcohol dehydrogenase [Porphyromonas levii]|uniref:iron-containing alcohol dehydrogenase n=1 Tax=Porphyromonas levii TaxID=28114 RepID=UPI001B8ACE97|nr:iron-containing alcohol dehydrogenase [Porphyromonas levii]MBR8713158.1 Alcohol dehydrogenase YqhD [Porphyromonas levii]MBR8714647.1 Alcohol dehydrogenase YqhD [Porphyromonas levii]MBR8727689.1 Alcohol dehydrogenase YqhD [Porphyromonas levii]MBR8736061.1 Alcohol dehydrogenase YqhD [Porphyromonas levii]MBR8759536.1 Alcohol dehydrogenase YqhD [Porphyromonas levii]